jgi:polyferredoxin
VFLALLALSLHAMTAATLLAEVEPFKTAITLSFNRSWPYVAYALALLAIGLFVQRLYCIYCLACQMNYFDDKVCPPLVHRRERRQAPAARQSATPPQ